MISFIWSDQNPMYSGRGGMENFTAGHVRELTEMGIESQVVTVGLGANNSEFFNDINFVDLQSIKETEALEGTVVFINVPHMVKTINPSFVLFHCPPRLPPYLRAEYKRAMEDKQAIVTSKFMKSIWTKYLGLPDDSIPMVYPFADPAFANVDREYTAHSETKVLFAGRLMPEKGVYLYLEAMQQTALRTGFIFSITNAGNQTFEGAEIEAMIKHHPRLNVVEARHTPATTAALLAQHDILVMPSNNHYWHEGFGMLSVEAQHAGCQVIGSDNGGLPETNCGGLTLFEPGDSMALAETIRDVSQAYPVTPEQRKARGQFFTRRQSVESLLAAISMD